MPMCARTEPSSPPPDEAGAPAGEGQADASAPTELPATIDMQAPVGQTDAERAPGAANAEPGPAPTAPGASVLVLAPVGRDAALAVAALAAAGIRASVVGDAPALLKAVAREVRRQDSPELGAVLVTDDALGIEWSGRLEDLLEQQPPWSDLPIVLLAGAPTSGDGFPASVAARLTARGSITVLDRPVRVAALVSAVSAALRARARQAEVHDLIEARARALAEAERANRAKSAFLALMSHELRTPLNAIAGYVELIDDAIYGPVTPAQREALGRVVRAQQHLLALINDLLDFARIESGRLELHTEPMDLGQAVTEVVTMVEGQLTTRGLSYATQLPPSPVHVTADPERLRQILLNLLSNATKFTRSGGRITITVDDVAPDATGGEAVRLHVGDTGIGIPPDELEAIFQPFVQAHRNHSPGSQQGTGLGLPISRQLARGMGGDLTATSRPGEGSTFTLTLRRADT